MEIEKKESEEVYVNKIPDFKTLQEAMADVNTIRFINKRLEAVEIERAEFVEKLNKQAADFNAKRGIKKESKYRIKRSAYDILKLNGMLNVRSITEQTILIALHQCKLKSSVRGFIELISHNAIADMLNFYTKGETEKC